MKITGIIEKYCEENFLSGNYLHNEIILESSIFNKFIRELPFECTDVKEWGIYHIIYYTTFGEYFVYRDKKV